MSSQVSNTPTQTIQGATHDPQGDSGSSEGRVRLHQDGGAGILRSQGRVSPTGADEAETEGEVSRCSDASGLASLPCESGLADLLSSCFPTQTDEVFKPEEHTEAIKKEFGRAFGSTCVECGRKMPAGSVQLCAETAGGCCSWRVPAALNEFLSSQHLEISRLQEQLADMATQLRKKSEVGHDLLEALRQYEYCYGIIVLVGESTPRQLTEAHKAALQAIRESAVSL